MQFVPPEDPVKISRLTITNRSNRTRLLSITAYVEWVLGVSGSASAPHIVTERDEKTGAIFARNVWNTEFANRVAFADLAGKQTEWTADRTEFLGRNGSLDHPASLERGGTLLGRAGAGLDPCAALQTTIELAAGKSTDVVFFLGQAASREQSAELVIRLRSSDLNKLFVDVRKQWDDLLGTVQVRTPDRAMDILMNRWLPYQTISCRLWARAGFYQAGGGYGFRDQLQDALSTVVTKRDLARQEILRAAARQFPEGDVQHWWHPPSGRGVRTKISDDLLWLPYAVSHYIAVTGEFEILDEMVPFVQGATVPDGKEDAYFEPTVTQEHATLFEHCARALDRSLKVGAHGLPLMGSGDWNDGMNRVGHKGQGESVWLAWFLHSILFEFAKIADRRGETARAQTWRLHLSDLKTAVEHAAWDGEWYKRAFFDDGTPLGSSTNAECRIDSIAQSWAVLSGAADPARAAMAMTSLEKNLIRRNEGLVLLFTPPFENTQPSPGYIQGYPRGVRENGGQYTHAAVWSMMAFAALGNGDKAGELFKLLNPIRRSGTRADIHRYKVEPYVMAGDVYSEPPHAGRGGWTWYTGSAGWMFRAGVESILGFHLRGTTVLMDPCIPRSWPSFSLSFRYHSSRYDVVVENPDRTSRGIKSATMDGHAVRGGAEIHLTDDGQVHQIRIVMGPA
jgi:cyclic beta-1,2-glucan synthetase